MTKMDDSREKHASDLDTREQNTPDQNAKKFLLSRLHARLGSVVSARPTVADVLCAEIANSGSANERARYGLDVHDFSPRSAGAPS